MQKTNISWADYVWNPACGCKHNCNFKGGKCYAERMNNRFHWIKNWNEPQVFIERLSEPYKFNKWENRGKKVFVCSISDLFGSWVPADFIEQVIKTAATCHYLEFMFLTKNPSRYLEFKFSDNCWIGATVTNGKQVTDRLIKIFKDTLFNRHGGAKCFLSIEPLMGSFEDSKIEDCYFDKLIVGGLTGAGADKINRSLDLKAWTEHIQSVHKDVHIKENLKKYIW